MPNGTDPDRRPVTTGAAVSLGAETETDHGWTYEVAIDRADGRRTTHRVTLAWVDHDHLSGGSTPPSKVVEGVLRAALPELSARPLPERFDIATVRRLVPDLVERMRLPGD